jgi:hypothetical protein
LNSRHIITVAIASFVKDNKSQYDTNYSTKGNKKTI